MGTVHDKIVDTLEVGYTLEDKTIRTPPVFQILTSPPLPKQSQLSYRKVEQGHKTQFGGGEGKACLRA